MTTVTVKPGDTLSGIAERELGDASKWPMLYNLNEEAIRREQTKGRTGPDWIYPGTVLKLPD